MNMKRSKMKRSKMKQSKMKRSKMNISNMKRSKMKRSIMKRSKMKTSKMKTSKMKRSKIKRSNMAHNIDTSLFAVRMASTIDETSVNNLYKGLPKMDVLLFGRLMGDRVFVALTRIAQKTVLVLSKTYILTTLIT